MSQGEASNSLRTWEFRGYAPYFEWPQVTDAMIEASCRTNTSNIQADNFAPLEPSRGSCTRPLRIIILPPNRVQCPQLNPFWRGQGHGLTPVLLPTRSVSHPIALRHVACQLVSAG